MDKANSLHGIVYVAEELADAVLPGPTRYYGHWEAERAGGVIEQGPGWNDVEEAVAWGIARAPTVLLRLGASEPQTHYWAGERKPQGIPPPGAMRRWAPRRKNEEPSR